MAYKLLIILCIIFIFSSCTSKREKAIEFNKAGLKKYYNMNFDGALEDFNKSIDADPAFDQAYYNRGNLKYSKTDYQGAITDYSKAIEINPGFADAFFNRGNVYHSINQMNKACEDWVKARDLGRPNLEEKIRNCYQIN